MNALKSHTFLRPSSRPSSPAPSPTPPPSRPDSLDRVARPLNRLSGLTTFRRPSPAPQNPSPAPAAVPLVQDGSYLNMLSLKLNEAVTKALAQSPGPAAVNEQVAGRKPIPAGRGRILGTLISCEVKAANGNAPIFKAIMRSLQRPLSVLQNNLSTQLASLLASADASSLPTTQSPNPNATQLHVIGITTFAGELLESFDELGLGFESDPRGDGLKPVRDGLVSLVTRGLNALLSPIRKDLVPIIEALETPSSMSAKNGSGFKSHGHQHPSLTTLHTSIPVVSKALARYITSAYAQKQLATLLINIVWRGLVALAHRPSAEFTPPSSPGLNGSAGATNGTSNGVKKRRNSPSSTPPLTPPTARFNIKLPPSRPSSPPMPAYVSPIAADAKALYDILNQLPRPNGESEPVRLAREAVDEAFDALKALAPFIELLHMVAPLGFNNGISKDHISSPLQKQLEDATEDIPTLICLPCFLRGSSDSIPALLGLEEGEYRNACLSGFARAEECADAVGQRVLEILLAKDGSTPLTSWLGMELVPSDDEFDD